MTPAQVATLRPRTRGDRVDIALEAVIAGMDFADVYARMDLRLGSYAGAVLATVRSDGVGNTAGASLTLDTATVGSLGVVAAFPDGITEEGSTEGATVWIYGDLLVSREDPEFGPYTLVKFRFELLNTTVQHWA